jgi:adenosine deaminase
MIDPLTLPKAELHLHIEGTLEPELMFELARRNGVSLPYADADAVRRAYRFSNLQSFLDVYYRACSVLIHERDFYELTTAYLARARSQGFVTSRSFSTRRRTPLAVSGSKPWSGELLEH